jgi:dTDP-4-amino-4,6-dideoxygalactose transaminase
MVPFVDLKAQYKSIKPEIDAAIARVIQSASFILGPEVENFEQTFAQYVGAQFCVGVNPPEASYARHVYHVY